MDNNLIIKMKIIIIVIILFHALKIVNAESVDIVPRRYAINLSAPPEERWTYVVRDHLNILPMVVEEVKRFLPSFLQRPFFWLAEKLSSKFPDDLVGEMRGISNMTGLPLGEIIGINILYDITDFKKSFFPYIACTSIVAENKEGHILHARNLDYDMGSLLRKSTVIVDFLRDNKILYSATTFVMQVGILTGQRYNVFSASLNARYSGGIFDNIFMELFTRFGHPVSFEIRKTLEEEINFEDAVQRLSKTHFVAPSYITVGGSKSGEGAIITRNRWSAADVYRLDVKVGRWFLLETNYDHWNKSKDKRRILGTKYMNEVGRDSISSRTIFSVISKHPVLNENTIFSTVMSARETNLFYNFTYIRMPKGHVTMMAF